MRWINWDSRSASVSPALPASIFALDRGAMPRMQHRRRIGVALHSQGEPLSAAGTQLDSQQRRIDPRGLLSNRDALELMLAVRPALHYQGPWLRFVKVHQRHHGLAVG